MGSKNISLRNRMLFYILPIVTIVLLNISINNFLEARKTLIDGYNDSKKQIEINIKNSIKLIDSGYKMLDKELEKEMNKKMDIFIEAYNKNPGDPFKMELFEIQNQLGKNYELYVIDRETTVIYSTTSYGYNFNFKKFFNQFSPKSGELMDKIREGEKIHFERIRTNVESGFLSKFAYMPTPDNEYILEIIYASRDKNKIVEELTPLKITNQLKEISPIVDDIKIYDIYGYQFVDDGKSHEISKKALAKVRRAKEENEFEIEGNGIVEKYLLVDLKENTEVMQDESKVVEILYNRRIIDRKLRNMAVSNIMLSFISIFTLFITIMILSGKLTKPIRALKQIAEKIKNGDYSVRANIKINDEIGELGQVINNMAKQIQKNFAEIEEYNETLSQKVNERTKELKEKNNELEEKNEKILDSILYANTIQSSILPRYENIKKDLEDIFLIWKPRDIVGGDFYWHKKIGNNYFLGLIDCTGHGVPGALMTMTVNAIMNRIVDTSCNNNPAKILKELNYVLKNTLHRKDTDKRIDDGLDIALCYIKSEEKELVFAGAKLSLYYTKENDLIRLKGDKQSIGYRRSKEDFDYKNVCIKLEENMKFYMCTDGYTDQNGGEENKVFGQKRFVNMIKKNQEIPLDEQREIYINNLKRYQAENNQRDDISFIGFKI